jgi:hypothetical protein
MPLKQEQVPEPDLKEMLVVVWEILTSEKKKIEM